MNLIDLTGRKYGRLTVIARAPDHVQPCGHKRAMWSCGCDCGKVVTVLGDNLKNGRTKSCGCYRKDWCAEHHSTHHETNSKLYGVWCAMKARCYNGNTIYFDRYGGRGIEVCDEWREHYEVFRDWAVGSGYHEGLSIDRINNDGMYSPNNCRWVVAKTQAGNRHNNRMLTLNGETHTVTEWATMLGLNPKTVFTRVYSGKTAKEALATK